MLSHQGYSHDDNQSEEQTAESSDSEDDDAYIHQQLVQQPREHLQGIIDLFWNHIIFTCFDNDISSYVL